MLCDGEVAPKSNDKEELHYRDVVHINKALAFLF